MFDFIFFVKTFAITIGLVALMQIKAGNETLETKATAWIRSSAVTEPMQSVATGGAKALRDSTLWVKNKVRRNVDRLFGSGSGERSSRQPTGVFKRSQAYEKQREQQHDQESALKKVADDVEAE
jgi:hypothetical protein